MKICFFALVAISSCAVMSACSSMSDACRGAAVTGGTNVPIVGSVVTLSCAANAAAVIGTDVAHRTGGDPAPPPPKSFQSSKLVVKDLSDNGDVMQFVIDSQDKYRAGDFGDATEIQKKEAIGRYASASLGKTILIKENEKAWNVYYESEPVPTSK